MDSDQLSTRPHSTVRPDVLVCAGLDPSGGAGLIADVRVIAELGARPVGIATAMTVQNTTGVVNAESCDPELVESQLTCLLTDIEVRAVKIGMLCGDKIAAQIAKALALTHAPVVWDPIAAPSRGGAGCDISLELAADALGPHLTVITPNAPELARLTGSAVTDLASAEAAGRALAARFHTAVFIKGGHLDGQQSIDVLIDREGRQEFRIARIEGGQDVHGTGCALSSALATFLALGEDLARACSLAKQYVAARLVDPARPGRGAAAVL